MVLLGSCGSHLVPPLHFQFERVLEGMGRQHSSVVNSTGSGVKQPHDLGVLFVPSEPQFLTYKTGTRILPIMDTRRIVGGLNEVIHVKCLVSRIINSKFSVSVR